MEIENEELLKIYMWGFRDELDGKVMMTITNPLLLRAYNLGKADAIIGDDLSSSDSQTKKEILNRIRN